MYVWNYYISISIIEAILSLTVVYSRDKNKYKITKKKNLVTYKSRTC